MRREFQTQQSYGRLMFASIYKILESRVDTVMLVLPGFSPCLLAKPRAGQCNILFDWDTKSRRHFSSCSTRCYSLSCRQISIHLGAVQSRMSAINIASSQWSGIDPFSLSATKQPPKASHLGGRQDVQYQKEIGVLLLGGIESIGGYNSIYLRNKKIVF